jgi:hypothetical protein
VDIKRPDIGVMEENVGAGYLLTVNAPVLFTDPPKVVVTVTVYGPIHAPGGIAIVPVICDDVILVITAGFKRKPVAFLNSTVVLPGTKLDPTIVNETVWLRYPNGGVIEVNVGAGYLITVKAPALLTDPPSTVVTLTVYGPSHAVAGIAIVPMICDEMTPVSTAGFKRDPVAFRNSTVVLPGMKLDPTIVNETVWLRYPDDGVRVVMTGGGVKPAAAVLEGGELSVIVGKPTAGAG